MKTKNILVLGAIGVALYYLLKKDNVNPQEKSDNQNTLDQADKDLNAVMNGDEPMTLGSDEKDKLFTATLGYTGGARPTEEMIKSYESAKESALRRVEQLGLEAELKMWLTKRKKPLFQFPMSKTGEKEIANSKFRQLKGGLSLNDMTFRTYGVNTTRR